MKINAIKLNYNAPVFNANSKPENNKGTNSVISGKNIAIGIAGIAAIGIATFAILKGKKPSAKAINETAQNIEKAANKADNATESVVTTAINKSKPEIIESAIEPLEKTHQEAAEIIIEPLQKTQADTVETVIPQQQIIAPQKAEAEKVIEKFKVTNTETKTFSQTGIGESEPFEGVEKLIYVDYQNGKGRTYQQFYHNNKIYEYNVYDEILGENALTNKITRYNIAYENGKFAGVAKQDIYKDGLQHGEYKDNGFDPFPVMVKMKGDKDFHDAQVYTSDALFELDKRFSPYNL